MGLSAPGWGGGSKKCSKKHNARLRRCCSTSLGLSPPHPTPAVLFQLLRASPSARNGKQKSNSSAGSAVRSRRVTAENKTKNSPRKWGAAGSGRGGAGMGRRGGSAGPGSPQPFKATGRRLRCVEPRGAERALMAAQELQREKGGKKKLLKEKWSLGAPPPPPHAHTQHLSALRDSKNSVCNVGFKGPVGVRPLMSGGFTPRSPTAPPARLLEAPRLGTASHGPGGG